MADPYNLQRFVSAQEPVMESVMAELRAGRKHTHWMWFVFPQLAGLGRSSTALHFAVSGVDEAIAFLAHPILGDRLRDCCNVILALQDSSAESVFGAVDALKLCSSMTLFYAASNEPVFHEVLLKYYQGQGDATTFRLLEAAVPET